MYVEELPYSFPACAETHTSSWEATQLRDDNIN